MYIQQNNSNISMTGSAKSSGIPENWKKLQKRVKQTVLDAMPESTIKDGARRVEKWTGFDDRISRPAENRAIMGATAILTQPLIDVNNKRVNEDTRTVSKNRTISKIIAGTLVGIIVRGSSYKLIEKMTDIKGKSKYSKSLIPKQYMNEAVNNAKFLKNYRSALSTFTAVLAMCVTNFVLDAPLTVFLTNYFNMKSEKARKKKEEQIPERKVANA